MNNQITINMNDLSIAKDSAGNFIIQKDAELKILKFLKIKQQMEDFEDYMKAVLSERMAEKNIVKIEGEYVSATKRAYGDKYELTDRDIALAQGIAKTITSVKPDSEAIEKAVKATGQLPEGVKLRDRQPTVSISLKKEKNARK